MDYANIMFIRCGAVQLGNREPFSISLIFPKLLKVHTFRDIISYTHINSYSGSTLTRIKPIDLTALVASLALSGTFFRLQLHILCPLLFLFRSSCVVTDHPTFSFLR